jgi:hypothetical protein
MKRSRIRNVTTDPDHRREWPGVAKLRANFEGKQAIYVEKGALLVRVSDIRQGLSTVAAQIEEIPTPGLPGFLGTAHGEGPLRWTIRAGGFTQFSDHCWQMGYCGWSIYFEPGLIRAVLQLTAEFPPTLDAHERYGQICGVVQQDRAALNGRWETVVPAVLVRRKAIR